MGDFLLVTIQFDMHDQLASTLQNDMNRKIAEAHNKNDRIDISSLEI
jgi:rsbT antagonist protein RsbS